MSKLIHNSIQTPDGTILVSHHQHDYISHLDANGKNYFTDGGCDYVRRSLHIDEPPLDLNLYDDSPHEEIRKALTWGSRGIEGDQPLVRKPIKDLDLDHIEAILRTQHQIKNTYMEKIFIDELRWRDEQ